MSRRSTSARVLTLGATAVGLILAATGCRPTPSPPPTDPSPADERASTTDIGTVPEAASTPDVDTTATGPLTIPVTSGTPAPAGGRIEVLANVRAIIGRPAPGRVAITIDRNSDLSDLLVRVLMPAPAAPIQASGRMTATLSGGASWSADMIQMTDWRLATMMDAAGTDFNGFYDGLCDGDDPATLTATWSYGGDADQAVEIGTLTCDEIDLSGLVDPKGHIDFPNVALPGACSKAVGVMVELMRLEGATDCPSAKPTDGWRFFPGPGPSQGTAMAIPAGTTTPEPEQLTGSDGVFAWQAPPGCYFVRVTTPGGGCTFHSQALQVVAGTPILDLNMTLLNAPNAVTNCGFQSRGAMTLCPTPTP